MRAGHGGEWKEALLWHSVWCFQLPRRPRHGDLFEICYWIEQSDEESDDDEEAIAQHACQWDPQTTMASHFMPDRHTRMIQGSPMSLLVELD